MNDANEELKDIIRSIGAFWIILIPAALFGIWWFLPEDTKIQVAEQVPVGTIASILETLIYGLVVLLIVGIVVLVIRAIIIGVFEKRRMCYFLWLPHADDTVSLSSLTAITKDLYAQKRVWYERLLKGKEQFILIIHNDTDNRVRFYVGMPRDRRRNVLTSLRGLYRLSEFYEAEPANIYPSVKTYKRQLHTNRLTSLQRKFEFDPVGALIDKMEDDSWIEIRVTPDKSGTLERAVKLEDKKQKFDQKQARKTQNESGQVDGVSMDDARRLVRRLRPAAGDVEMVFDVVIQVESTRKLVATDLGMTITSLTQHSANSLKIMRTPWYQHVITEAPFLIGKSFKMTTSELAAFFHLPDIDENE
ncbi:hypothetical protein [Culicoidibacter larvae]|uniref:Uncharacterized protein n=1 Tax=Culicoidibacter larvae TaxID=2579976 RepID=A0A5R8Q815_9FIRM|nr:hypothetical protein [Culicoidibacter larvae]TLG71281.1 hypothetical protein FEZ08_11060 [Culicoidibacter larvae]